MTLKQHLGNTGCSAKVSVNLERRMCIPQIIQRTVLQQIATQGISMITIMQTRPLIQLPAHAPAGDVYKRQLQPSAPATAPKYDQIIACNYT